jgi:hypothetical protein
MIEFKKYKRFFAFGCSMTDYWWPTWADIIGKEFDQYYNFGRSGAGNTFISLQVAEANQRYNFTRDDLVIIMWSSVTREDRYVKRYWQTPGNIYTQNYYDDDYIKKYSDLRGYLIRDLGLIYLTHHTLTGSGCEYHMLNMSPFVSKPSRYSDYNDTNPSDDLSDIVKLYDPLIRMIKPDLLSTGCNGVWPQTPMYHNKNHTIDYHPSPLTYLSYIQTVFPRLPISEETINWVRELDAAVKAADRIDQLDSKSWKLRRMNPEML